jgi:hypothetical protein
MLTGVRCACTTAVLLRVWDHERVILTACFCSGQPKLRLRGTPCPIVDLIHSAAVLCAPPPPLLQVWDNERVVIIPDHYIFTADPRANRNVDILRYGCLVMGVVLWYGMVWVFWFWYLWLW